MTGQYAANLDAVKVAFAEGLDALQIAERLNISRGYVYALLKSADLTVSSKVKPSADQARAKDVRRKYRAHRRGATQRGIPFNLTQEEWWQIWDDSGHWAERGRGAGYMMCRFRDEGAYEVGNVRITTGKENIREAVYFSGRSTSRLIPVPPSDPDHPVTPQSLHQSQHYGDHQQHPHCEQRSAGGAVDALFSHGARS